MKQVLCGILFLALNTDSGIAREDKSSTRVLFIGNSYTYYHSMPQLFRPMAEQYFPGRQIRAEFVGWGGATLKQQWENGRGPEQIRSGIWDYVVLQEQSMLGGEVIEDDKSYVRSPDQFFEYASKFVRVSRKHGADPVFSMTWSRKEYPHQQKYLTYAYMTVARKTGSKIAPAGIAWDQLRTMTSFDLYEEGGSHPSVYGSYLTALMLFSIIFDTDPTGMPGRLKGYEMLRDGRVSEEIKVLCDLPENEARIIQNTVSKIFQQMKKGNGYLEVPKAVSDKKPSTFSTILTYLSDSKNQVVILIIIGGMIVIVKGGFFLFKIRT